MPHLSAHDAIDYPASWTYWRGACVLLDGDDPGPEELPATRPGSSSGLNTWAKNTEHPFRAAFEAALPRLSYPASQRRWESLRIALAPKKMTKTLKPLD